VVAVGRIVAAVRSRRLTALDRRRRVRWSLPRTVPAGAAGVVARTASASLTAAATACA